MKKSERFACTAASRMLEYSKRGRYDPPWGKRAVTEAEWLSAIEPESMLLALRGKASNRKLRLFAVACCRRIAPLFTDERSRAVLKVAENYADGLAGDRHLHRAADHNYEFIT